jgi:hypothetical protein
MKKLAATLCIAATALTLAACETTTADNGPGYATERTAGDGSAPAPAERVFQEKQMK